MSKISIVMPTYNQASFIKEAIESIQAQTFKDWTMTIVNDASTDDTYAIIQEYLADPRIKVLHNEFNMGTGFSLNRGFLEERSEYQTWVSSDNVYYPTWLEDLNKVLDEHPEIGLVYADTETNRLPDDGSRRLMNEPWPEYERRLIFSRCYLGIALLWRKEVQDKAGTYIETRACEDYDMYIRMSRITDFMHLPKRLAYWRDHESSLTHVHCLQTGWKEHYAIQDQYCYIKEQPFFSIVMAARTKREWVCYGIQSVLDQTFKDWELIIVDDATEDYKVSELAEEFNDPRIKVIRNPVRKGPYISKQMAICASVGDYVTFCDGDDWLRKDSLEVRYRVIRSHISPAMVYSSLSKYIQDTGETVEMILSGGITFESLVNQINGKNYVLQIHGCTMAIRRDVLLSLGGYDYGRFPFDTADMDLAIRIMLYYGDDVKFIPDPLYYYRIHDNNVSMRYNYFGIKNWEMIRKTYGRFMNKRVPKLEKVCQKA